MVSGYPTFTSIPRVDGLSTDLRVLGRHAALFRGQVLEESQVVALMFWYSFCITYIRIRNINICLNKSDLLTLKPCNIVGWDILVSIDV